MTMLSRRRLAPLVVACTAMLLTACGGGSNDKAESTPTTTSASPTPAPTAPADPAAATAQIKTNWKAFFSSTTPQAKAATLLENGAKMGAALKAAADLQVKSKMKQDANVKTVTFTGPTEAAVTYELLGNGQPLLPNAQGKAVLQAGVWKVSDQTFCTLVALGSPNTPVPGCS